jgi:hypothetical protein
MRKDAASVLGLFLSGAMAANGWGQAETPRVAAVPVPPSAGATTADKQSTQFTYLLFHKQNDPNTQQFAETLRRGVARHPQQVNWTAVNVADPANASVVAKYGVSRAPMPLALCVANNGAITSVFTRRPNDETLDRALVTPAMVDVTKALQDKKIVVVHVKATKQAPLPYGAFEFTADPAFKARTVVIDVVANDPAEQRFLKDMKFNAASVRESSVVVMAPPAVLVGKFAASATMSDIATKLHAAGKCCNDPNCKHNKKANAQ